LDGVLDAVESDADVERPLFHGHAPVSVDDGMKIKQPVLQFCSVAHRLIFQRPGN
jgi:hypothetical protein